MPFYLRKAFRFGPFRLNLSKWGIGTSVGVKGFRIGQKPDGQQYIHAGREGLYFRENLGKAPAGASRPESATGAWESATETFGPQGKPVDYPDDPKAPLTYGAEPADSKLLDPMQATRLRYGNGVEWQVKADDGTVYTANSAETVRQWYQERRVRSDTPVFHPVLKKWMHLRDVSALRVPTVLDPYVSDEMKIRASLEDLRKGELEDQEIQRDGPPGLLASYEKIQTQIYGTPNWRLKRREQIESFEAYLATVAPQTPPPGNLLFLEWHVSTGGQVHKANALTIQEWYRERRVRPETQVYHPVLKKWMQIREVGRVLQGPVVLDPYVSVETRMRATLEDLREQEREYQKLLRTGTPEQWAAYDEGVKMIGAPPQLERLQAIQNIEAWLARPHSAREIRRLEQASERLNRPPRSAGCLILLASISGIAAVLLLMLLSVVTG